MVCALNFAVYYWCFQTCAAARSPNTISNVSQTVSGLGLYSAMTQQIHPMLLLATSRDVGACRDSDSDFEVGSFCSAPETVNQTRRIKHRALQAEIKDLHSVIVKMKQELRERSKGTPTQKPPAPVTEQAKSGSEQSKQELGLLSTLEGLTKGHKQGKDACTSLSGDWEELDLGNSPSATSVEEHDLSIAHVGQCDGKARKEGPPPPVKVGPTPSSCHKPL